MKVYEVYRLNMTTRDLKYIAGDIEANRRADALKQALKSASNRSGRFFVVEQTERARKTIKK